VLKLGPEHVAQYDTTSRHDQLVVTAHDGDLLPLSAYPWLMSGCSTCFAKRRTLRTADVDGDLDLDIVIVNYNVFGGYNNELYLNTNGLGKFRQVTDDVFVTDSEGSRGLEVADLDGDGDVDILVGNCGSGSPSELQNSMYINNGGGKFRKVLASDFISDEHYSVFVKAADIDGDGDLDVLVGEC
jgi:hypothetical protein